MQSLLQFFESLLNLFEPIGGILASLLTIIVFVKIVIVPFFYKLEIQLTKDLFFRLVESGEIFFARVVVHAPINIQIINFNFELKGKKETQETSYNCEAENFGSVERNSINERSVPSFYLPKRSPEFLLQKGESKELLIQCNIVGSKKEIEKSIESLRSDHTQLLKDSLRSDYNQSLKEKNQNIFSEKLNNCSTDILSNIKLESGDHTLLCKVVYKYKLYQFISQEKTVKSKIKINITNDSLNLYKDQTAINNFLLDYLISFNPNNKHIQIRYPVLRPSEKEDKDGKVS